MQGPVHARSVRVWIFLGVLFLVSQDALEVMFVSHSLHYALSNVIIRDQKFLKVKH